MRNTQPYLQICNPGLGSPWRELKILTFYIMPVFRVKLGGFVVEHLPGGAGLDDVVFEPSHIQIPGDAELVGAPTVGIFAHQKARLNIPIKATFPDQFQIQFPVGSLLEYYIGYNNAYLEINDEGNPVQQQQGGRRSRSRRRVTRRRKTRRYSRRR